ncbi:zf-TFIIB domain-containing protein [Myxococcus sp. RHSTA-1-4]|uniref:TFIIB-type zinc ribbon-containing protein n=1 Tax=Myxococcus sp. RHSTA-1-4 TaxID=2874601 RepID=UPI001CBC18F3|nr:zf-TFIIB domain-containing protein [Myxococcus sp. RHSTA-1-4]MBZ4418835.1 zf-TFIIB domain-containing protein [Myxococcus sp. RHSTA-1-4]
MSRPCPICLQHPLRTTELHGVRLDTCDHCKGQWLESGELERLAPAWKSDALWEALRAAPRRCRHARHPVPFPREKCGHCGSPAARCPTCDELLSQVRMPVCAVDVCGQCHGLWLDEDELTLLRRAPRKSLKPLVGAAAVAAATTAAMASAQPPAASASLEASSAREVVSTVAEVAVDVVTDGTLEMLVSGVGTAAQVAMEAVEGASAVGTAVGEAMAAVLTAVAEVFN